ncbi:ribonuclease HII [Geitlerinema sp. P-1104]|uniref:ribonuclease HII n=1 Tax=Geitlerinema sp. P-1104 TaxID=2546230 RepID=UPI001476BE19|nr:ribonuclease HII [Geitlerinema sp. P-1104]NMG57424.1 ribonuclease HII [Geitlerinema sp. P-1104]
MTLFHLTPLPRSSWERVAGVDEVGRGALFGPVVAAAVLLTSDQAQHLYEMGVKDSKQLGANQRQALSQEIRAIALDVQVAQATVAEIDQLNILNASLLAMKRAILALTPVPDGCLIDGNRAIPELPLPQETRVGGDGRETAIAAASIVAKVWRDAAIVELASIYPHYDLGANKGYGTAKHRQALEEFGVSPEHRRSFAPCRTVLDASQQQLDLLD